MKPCPPAVGRRPDGHCGRCNSRPEHHARTEWGEYCLACFHYLDYVGPPRPWCAETNEAGPCGPAP